jgi:hypothetical protein
MRQDLVGLGSTTITQTSDDHPFSECDAGDGNDGSDASPPADADDAATDSEEEVGE